MQLLKAILLPYRSVGYMEFDVGPFTVLFGKNNAGKTNILEAIYGVLAPRDVLGHGEHGHLVAPARGIRGGSAPSGALYVELEQGLPFDNEVLSTDDPGQARPLVTVLDTGTITRDGEHVTLDVPRLPPRQVAFLNEGWVNGPMLSFVDPRDCFVALHVREFSSPEEEDEVWERVPMCIGGPRPRPLFLDWEFDDINERVGSAIIKPLIDAHFGGSILKTRLLGKSGWLESVDASSPPGAWRVRPEIHQTVDSFAELATGLLPDFIDGSIRAEFHVPAKWGASPWVSVEYVERGTGQRVDSVADIGRGAARWIAAATQLAQHVMADAFDRTPVPGPKPFSGHVVFVDEPEAHLHPFAVASIVRWCRRMVERGFNVVVASHHEEFLRAAGDDVTFVEVTRDLQHSHTRARTLPSAAIPLRQELAARVGMHPAIALSFLRAILFVEGPLDEAVLAEFAGPQLDAAGVLIIPIHGTKNLEGLIDGEFASHLGIKAGVLTDNTITTTMWDRSNRKRSGEEIKLVRLIKRFEDQGLPPPDLFGVAEDDLLFAIPPEGIRQCFATSGSPFPGWLELREECRQALGKGASDSVDWKAYAEEHYHLPLTTADGVRSVIRALDLAGVQLPSIRAVVDDVIAWAKRDRSIA